MTNKVRIILEEIAHTIKNNLENYEDLKTIKINDSLYNKTYCDETNITTCEEHLNIFKELKEFKNNPVLYWFTLDEKLENPFHIIEYYKAFKNSNIERASSAENKKKNLDSKCLYVGKVKKEFHLRLVTHLGYSKNKDTAGLQLFHWYSNKDFGELSLYYIVFKEEMKDLISMIELEFARELRPIIGKY